MLIIHLYLQPDPSHLQNLRKVCYNQFFLHYLSLYIFRKIPKLEFREPHKILAVDHLYKILKLACFILQLIVYQLLLLGYPQSLSFYSSGEYLLYFLPCYVLRYLFICL